MYSKDVVGTEPAERMFERPYAQHIGGIAKDGTISFWSTTPESGTSLWVIPPGEQPRLFLDPEFSPSRGRFSPRGDLLAYTAANPPYAEVFLVAYPEITQRVQVSNDGGQEPVWSPDGKELFYRKGDDIMAVSVNNDNGLSVGVPRVILHDLSIAKTWSNYRISPDGKRFLVLQRDPDAVPRQINVILNWMRGNSEIRRTTRCRMDVRTFRLNAPFKRWTKVATTRGRSVVSSLDASHGADERDRTVDLLITNQPLYHLSYVGNRAGAPVISNRHPSGNLRSVGRERRS